MAMSLATEYDLMMLRDEGQKRSTRDDVFLWLFSVLCGSQVFLGVFFTDYQLPLFIAAQWILILWIIFFERRSSASKVMDRWTKGSLGLLFMGVFPSFLALLVGEFWGRQWILFFLILIWATDSGSWFIGKLFGTGQFAFQTRWSPKKTREGTVGGLVIGVLAAFLFSWLVFEPLGLFLPWHRVFIVAVFLAIFAQVGDLAESLMKRSQGVKDSGQLIPGHGGLLDRLDSIVFTAPLMFWASRWLVTGSLTLSFGG